MVFVLFFLAAAFLVWPKILAGLDAREQKIRREIEAACADPDVVLEMEKHMRNMPNAAVVAHTLGLQGHSDLAPWLDEAGKLPPKTRNRWRNKP